MIRLKHPKHVLVFAVNERQKVGSFFTPYNSEELFTTQEVWVAQMGAGCGVAEEGVKVGDKCLIQDFFEITTFANRHSSWDEMKDMDEFAEVAEIAASSAGKVACCVIHEDSLLARCE